MTERAVRVCMKCQAVLSTCWVCVFWGCFSLCSVQLHSAAELT